MVIVVAAFNLCKFLTEMGGVALQVVLVCCRRAEVGGGGGASGFNQLVSESVGHAHRRT